MTRDIDTTERGSSAGEKLLPRRIFDWMRAPEFPNLLDDTPVMRIEEFKEDSQHVVRAEIPGIDPDRDVELSVEHGVLHLRAERHETEVHRGHGSFRSEFKYGSFERALRLPSGASEDDVTATYKDGILEVRVPVDTEAAEAHKIEVQRL